jgi:hypothetical protein
VASPGHADSAGVSPMSAAGHKPSFTARSKLSPRRACEWQVSGDESGYLYG